MKLLRFKACLLAMSWGNGESKITDCNGRCRSGWVFGQGFDSPQVHKKSLTGWNPVGLFFCTLRVIEPVKCRKHKGFWTGAHEVQWTSVLRRPSRQARLRLPSGPLKMDCAKTVISDRFRPFQFKKSGVQTGVQKWAKKPVEMRLNNRFYFLHVLESSLEEYQK